MNNLFNVKLWIVAVFYFIRAHDLFAQSDYSKYRLVDSGHVDFTTKNTRFVSNAPFELSWLYQGKYNDKVFSVPVGVDQAYRYTFIQDTSGDLMYYADHAGVYSNRSGILFKSYLMNKKVSVPGCWPTDSFYPIPNISYKCGIQNHDTLEDFGYSNCVRFGKTNHYGVGIWDYLNNGFRLLRLSYDPVFGDKIVSSTILPNAGKFTTLTCGPNDSTFWVVSLLKNMHTIQVYFWSHGSLQLNQTFELGDTSSIKAYAQRMKFSPDNSKMVLLKRYKSSDNIFGIQSNPQNTSYLFDFNSQVGILSNKQKVSIYGNRFEFSPNSKYIYIKHLYSTMDSNMYLFKPSNSGYLSRFDINTHSAKLLFRKSGGFGSSAMQLLSDGNIYWYTTVGENNNYVFERFENTNDSQIANFKKKISDIDVFHAYRFRSVAAAYSIYPEILPCKCYEPEPKPSKIESCSKDTLIVQNQYSKYDSLGVDWGDGSSNTYKDLDSVFKHGYAQTGKYIVKTNYSSVFQDFTTTDTIITISHKPLNIPRDTFICPKDTLSLDLAIHDSNLIWSSSAKSLKNFHESGYFNYQYKEGWCNFVDSIHIEQKVKLWNLPIKDTLICFGEHISISVPAKYKIFWDKNLSDTTAFKIFKLTGNHELSFSDGYCNYNDSISVTVSSPINLKVVQLDTTVCQLLNPLEFQISGNTLQIKSIFWNDEQTNSLQFSTNKLSQISTSVIDTFGCKEEVRIDPISNCQSHIYIPNAFTPNRFGPEANEYFKPVITDGILKSFKIYNRWGAKIFDNPHGEGWDGTCENVESPEGIYIYNIEIITNFGESNYIYRYFGNFQLIR
jgi:gliding motility-associated-like protein